MIKELPKANKGQYIKLMEMLDENEKSKLEQEVADIKQMDQLCKFIDHRSKVQQAYQEVFNLLPQNEQLALKKQLEHAKDLQAKEKIIDKASRKLNVINHIDKQMRQYYMDLLQVLPETQAVSLKDKVMNCTVPQAIEQLVQVHLPKSINHLDMNTKKKIAILSDIERQKVLVQAMQEEGMSIHPDFVFDYKEEEEEEDDEVMLEGKEITAEQDKENQEPRLSTEKPIRGLSMDFSVKNVVDQKLKSGKALKMNIYNKKQQDEWGEQLPLKDKRRENFIEFLIQFSYKDRKHLKEIFSKSEAESIEAFFSVYDTGFSEGERIHLFNALLILYRKVPPLCLKLCNYPNSLGGCDKLKILTTLGKPEIAALKKLGTLLSA